MPFHNLTDHQLQICHYTHLQQVPNTRAVESVGRRLMGSSAVITGANLIAFSQQVCRWGGKTGARVFWRIKNNNPTALVKGFTGAIANLSLHRPNLLAARKSLAPISGLGGFSYLSKHLRMLAPEVSPVLDSVIDEFLVANDRRYANSPIDQRFLGYADFCQARARRLTFSSVSLGDFLNPANLGTLTNTTIPAQCQWTAADVDMACFAWLQGWHAGGSVLATNSTQILTMPSLASIGTNTEGQRARQTSNTSSKPTIFLVQSHERDTALTLREGCDKRWNNAWICRRHGSLDFKNDGAKGTTRYLIGEILAQGVDVTQDQDWEPSHDGKTCHHGGSNFRGRLNKQSVEDAVRHLKQFFVVRACPRNETDTQSWIDAL